MGSLSIWHWLILLVVVVLIFGTRKLRNVGSDLGSAVRGFKEGLHGDAPAEGAPRTLEGEARKDAADPRRDS